MKTKDPVCYRCNKKIADQEKDEDIIVDDVDDFYCNGCGKYICGRIDTGCNEGHAPWGKHSPEAHLNE